MVDTRFDRASFAPVAVSRRSGYDESLHHGAGVVVDAAGTMVSSIGDPRLHVYLRSALKPFQATAMVAGGLDLPDRLLALVAASHAGEAVHLDGVREILDRFGLDVDDLGNTPALPYGPSARSAARSGGLEPASLLQNCSGKHAGMLATCRVNGWPIADYLDPEHPLQERIVSAMRSLGAVIDHVGVDGCGAPTHALRLDAAARAFSRLVASGSPVIAAMRAHPNLVGGSDLDVTAWMDALPDLVAKEGADGVMSLVVVRGDRAGWACVFKIADGSDRVRRAVVPAALAALGFDVDQVMHAVGDRVRVPVFGGGREVGAVDPLPWSPAST